MKTEKEKMLDGEGYDPTDEELFELRKTAHMLSRDYNNTYDFENEKREKILGKLLPNKGKNCFLQGPVQFDYGVFTYVGDNFYANFNFTVLDTCKVTIGDNVFFGPNCTVATALHYLDPAERRTRFRTDGTPYDIEFGKPVTIGNDCWIASNVVICAGVTIGDNCVIGAGSVVVRDIPSGSVAVGNPCRVIKKAVDNDIPKSRMGGIIRKDINEDYAHTGIIKAGDLCFINYCAGNVGGTAEEQINGAFDEMERRLSLYGLTLENVVQMDCLFRDIWNIPIMEKVIKERFNGKYPVRKSIQTDFAHVGGPDGLQFQADAVVYCGK